MKKLIPVAVAAAVLGISSAQAVHVNPDGLGQVLIFPYYTVTGGQDTYVTLVNTTDQVKAVKVRFRESMNSDEVLDFNLYLSPEDHWSAVVYGDEDGAKIRTADRSCTLPTGLSNGDVVTFKDLAYKNNSSAPWNGINRTMEGYVEVIEMGVVTDSTLAAAATHVPGTGVPADCDALKEAFTESVGIWNLDPNDGMTAGTGGIYGYGVLIDVAEGTDASYDAVAFSDWNDLDPKHADPGDSDPNLSDGLAFADVIAGAEIVPMDFATKPSGQGGVDAISATIMKTDIANDYVLEPTIDAGTDWVITFPTKRTYTNTGSSTAIDPFTNVWNGVTGQACEQMELGYWNREEDFIQPDPEDLEYSPKPEEIIPVFNICHEANVLTFNSSNVLKPSIRTVQDFSVDYDNGWARMNFVPADVEDDRVIIDDNGVTVHGLPVVGFAVQKYVNGTLTVDGETVLSNYAGSILHKGNVNISSSAP